MDERSAVTEVPYRKVSMTAQSLARLGLYPHERVGWQCGDYCYYHLQEALPGYRHYWLIEPDVLFDLEEPAGFFALFAEAPQDFLATRFGPRGEGWSWTPPIRHRGLPVYGCLFPVTRLSARAIEYLRARRVADTAAADDKKGANWPNDESFVASHLIAAGYACADVNAAAGRTLCTAASVNWGDPFLLDEFEGCAPSGLLYHPVPAGPPRL
jgi:hypothetical protein